MAEKLYYREGGVSESAWVENINDATVEFKVVAKITAMRFPGARVRPVANRQGNQKWVVTKDKDSGNVISLRGARN